MWWRSTRSCNCSVWAHVSIAHIYWFTTQVSILHLPSYLNYLFYVRRYCEGCLIRHTKPVYGTDETNASRCPQCKAEYWIKGHLKSLKSEVRGNVTKAALEKVLEKSGKQEHETFEGRSGVIKCFLNWFDRLKFRAMDVAKAKPERVSCILVCLSLWHLHTKGLMRRKALARLFIKF